MRVTSAATLPDSGPAALDAAAERWLGSSPLMDLGDSRLRLKVQSLVQLRHAPRERAIAIYGFVKTLPFEIPVRFGVKTARQVLDERSGGWYAKTTLLVAMMRVAGIAARLRPVDVDAAVLRGLTTGHHPLLLPLAEMHLDGRWVRTDTHIFDPRTMSAARTALAEARWVRGFGVHRDGVPLWNGRDDAFAALSLDGHRSGMPLEDYGVYDDIAQFVAETRAERPTYWTMRMAHYRFSRLRLRRGFAKLRATHGVPAAVA